MKVYVLKHAEWNYTTFLFVTDKNNYEYNESENTWSKINKNKNTLIFEMEKNDVNRFFPEVKTYVDYDVIQEIELTLTPKTNVDVTEQVKKRVERYLINEEGASYVKWEYDDEYDSCTSYDEDDEPIHEYKVSLDDDGDIEISKDYFYNRDIIY